MAANDVKLQESSNVVIVRHKVKAGTTAINVGELVIVDGSNPGYVTKKGTSTQLTTADKIIGLAGNPGDGSTLGLASTQTASADGWVDVYEPTNGTTLNIQIRALTPASLAASQFEANHTIDISSGGVITFDQGTTTAGIAKMIPNVDGTIDTTNGILTAELLLSGYRNA
jgi:hypothetical protein